MLAKEMKILFVLYGEEQRHRGLIANRVIKLGYVNKSHVYTDISYEKDTHSLAWKKSNGVSALVEVTDLIDPETKSVQIRQKLSLNFDIVLPLHVKSDTSLIKIDDDTFRQEIEYGVSLSNPRVSEEEKIRLLLSRKKKLK